MKKTSSQKFIYGTCAAAAGAALSCAALPFDAYPLGFALLCASGIYTPLVLAGLCIGTLASSKSALLIAAYALTLALRVFVSLIGKEDLTLGNIGKYIFSEHISIRAVLASGACFGFGFFRLWQGGFLYYDLIAMLISMLSSGVIVLLWYELGGMEKKGMLSDIGVISFFAAVTWSLRSIALFGASLAVIFGIFVSLAITKKRGVIFASFTALICGLCVSLFYAPMFVFGVIAYSFFGILSPLIGCVFSFGVQMLWGYSVSGFSALGTLAPSLIAGNMIFYFFGKLFPAQKPTYGQPLKEETLREGLHSLEEYTAHASYEALKAKLCAVCRGVDGMTEAKCKVAGSVMSKFISDMLKLDTPYTPEAELSKGLFSSLRESLGENISAVYAYKSNRLNVAVIGDIAEKEAQITEIASRLCGMRFSAEQRKTENEGTYILLCQSSVLTLDMSGKKRNATGEKKFCGDNFEIIKPEDGASAVAFISDGMGSGREAARMSGVCSRFICTLLPKEMAEDNFTENFLDTLNLFLRTKIGQGECSCTLDFAQLDLLLHKLTLYKCGSAPTYVFRDGGIFRLHSNTVPMGIFEHADIGKTQLELLPNDVIVMVSDGAIDGEDDGDGLVKYLSERILTHTAEQLAESVIKYSDAIGSHDDVTAVAIKVGERVFES